MSMITNNSTLVNALFGDKNSVSSGSFLSSSSLGDWGLMRSGVYTKMLKSYYAKMNASSSDTGKTEKNEYESQLDSKLESLQNSTSDTALSNIKSAAGSMKTAAQTLADMDFETESRDKLYEGVKKLADTYNTVLASTAKSGLTSISQSVTWMVNDVKAHETQFEKIGIRIGSDNQLTIDKDKFSEAGLNDIRSLLEGNSGFASKLSQRASGLANLAANQISYNSGKTFYSSSGILG